MSEPGDDQSAWDEWEEGISKPWRERLNEIRSLASNLKEELTRTGKADPQVIKKVDEIWEAADEDSIEYK